MRFFLNPSVNRTLLHVCLFSGLFLLNCEGTFYGTPVDALPAEEDIPKDPRTSDLLFNDNFNFETVQAVEVTVNTLDADGSIDREAVIHIYDREPGNGGQYLGGCAVNNQGLMTMQLALPATVTSLYLERRYAGIAIAAATVPVENFYAHLRIARHNFGDGAADALPQADGNSLPYLPAKIIFFDDMDFGANGWTHYQTTSGDADNWRMTTRRAASGSSSWRVSQRSSGGGDALQSRQIDLRQVDNAVLAFKQWYEFDQCGSGNIAPDGGLVEISTDNGNNWLPLSPAGGYPGEVDVLCANPLGQRRAFVRNSGDAARFETVVVNLTPFCRNQIRIRFHAGWDCGTCNHSNDGWYIDDVLIASAAGDIDQDGVFDEEDRYPQNPNRSFDCFFPGKATFGTLAFEDNWPRLGDLDFNDLVIAYQYNPVINAAGGITALRALFHIRAVGSENSNGFAIELPVDAARIQRITAEPYTFLESNSGKAVIVLFPDVGDLIRPAPGYQYVNTESGSPYVESDMIALTVEFRTPLPMAILAEAPFNPFMIVNRTRGHEIHLPGRPPTARADMSFFGSEADDSHPPSNKFYKTARNIPWALHLPADWRQPLEQTDLIRAYLKFREWGENDGAGPLNWYVDMPGNVDPEYLWQER